MEGMSEKMENQRAAPLLPVSVDKKKKNQEEQPRAAHPPFLHINVQLVNLWTFLNAVAVTVNFAFNAAYDYTTFVDVAAAAVLPRAATKPTDAEGTLDLVFTQLLLGMLWCSTPQAIAASLAMLLPCHRWRLRRAAAYAALALTVASHCMFAGAVSTVSADPQALFLMIVASAVIFMCAVVDLLGFQALLRFREAEEKDDDLLGFLCG